MMNKNGLIMMVSAAVLLSGCTSMNLFKDSTPEQQVTAQPIQPPQAPALPQGQRGAGTLSAAQIKQLLAGKSWRWQGPKNGGVTLYASDGTSLVEVTGKGTTQGKWQVQDGQLCEQFAPAAFLPQGVPMTCQPFTGTNGNYMVGPATFRLAS